MRMSGEILELLTRSFNPNSMKQLLSHSGEFGADCLEARDSPMVPELARSQTAPSRFVLEVSSSDSENNDGDDTKESQSEASKSCEDAVLPEIPEVHENVKPAEKIESDSDEEQWAEDESGIPDFEPKKLLSGIIPPLKVSHGVPESEANIYASSEYSRQTMMKDARNERIKLRQALVDEAGAHWLDERERNTPAKRLEFAEHRANAKLQNKLADLRAHIEANITEHKRKREKDIDNLKKELRESQEANERHVDETINERRKEIERLDQERSDLVARKKKLVSALDALSRNDREQFTYRKTSFIEAGLRPLVNHCGREQQVIIELQKKLGLETMEAQDVVSMCDNIPLGVDEIVKWMETMENCVAEFHK